MQTELFSAGFFILVAAIWIIAANAIATECYDKNPQFKETKASNYNFSILNIVSAIILVMLAVYSMYVAYKRPSY